MNGKGIMGEIRGLLTQGKPSGEVIALDFKPSTVYKVQRQLRQKGQGSDSVSGPGASLPATDTTPPDPEPGLEDENARLRQEFENLEGQVECVLDADAALEVEVQTLRERVKVLEPKAAVADHWRQWAKELESQGEHATNTAETVRRAAIELHQKFESEKVARQQAEAEVARVQGELERWQAWGGVGPTGNTDVERDSSRALADGRMDGRGTPVLVEPVTPA